MDLYQFFDAINLSELALTHSWYQPMMEYFHYIGHSLLFGSIFFLDLRLMGLGKHIAVEEFSALATRLAGLGFVIAVITGSMLFLGSLDVFWGNPLLLIKLSLILLALLNIAIFHGLVSRHQDNWNQDCATPLSAKLSGLFSLLLWAAIIAAGRLMVYF